MPTGSPTRPTNRRRARWSPTRSPRPWRALRARGHRADQRRFRRDRADAEALRQPGRGDHPFAPVLVLLRADDAPARARPGRRADAPGLRPRHRGDPRRGHAAHAADCRQHAAQPLGHDRERRCARRARRAARTHQCRAAADPGAVGRGVSRDRLLRRPLRPAAPPHPPQRDLRQRRQAAAHARPAARFLRGEPGSTRAR